MSARTTSSGKNVAIQKLPWITERDVTAFSPYPAQDGTFGALFQLDDHGRVVLDTLSVERRGGFLFVFINGRMITELQIDKRVSDGKIYVPSGLTAADVELMKKSGACSGHESAKRFIVHATIVRPSCFRSSFLCSDDNSNRTKSGSRSCFAHGQ